MAGWDIVRAGGRTGLLIASVVAAGMAAPLAGQATTPVHNVHPVARHQYEANALESGRLRFEPWAGVLFDAYRNEGGDDRPGWIGAVRLAYELGGGLASAGRGWRITGEVARSEAAMAGTRLLADSLLVGFRTEWWLATAGLEWDVAGGPTALTGLTVGAHGGAAWVQREIVGGDPIPPGTPGTTERAESDPMPAVAIELSGYRYLTHRVQLRVRVADLVTDPFDAREHSPAVGVGVRFVFD